MALVNAGTNTERRFDVHCRLARALRTLARRIGEEALVRDRRGGEGAAQGESVDASAAVALAFEHYDAAIASQPKTPAAAQVLLEVARIYEEQGTIAGDGGGGAMAVVQALRRAVEADSSYATHGSLGKALNNVGLFQEALLHHEKALALVPEKDKFAIANNHAITLNGLNRKEEATAYFEMAVKLNPRCGVALNSLGEG